ncbi:hypothetical protein [Mesorhizobium atlanticum]|uniref:hypothetical protein n=1 Tax=Mesorhizobium atlanticum TaxID=2233532 RepID=UPI0011BD5D9D|nr:hypothetical protein [Mesorhizobium atlanticum]
MLTIDALAAAESGRIRQRVDRIVALRRVGRQAIAAESPPENGGRERTCRFFDDYGAGLLIVPPLFFIQRRDGEVAEWSKALPC